MPTANEIRAAQMRRRRGKVLKILQTAAPLAIADAALLYRLLDDAGESMTIAQVHELLRDLKERGCLRYEQKRVPDAELPQVQWIRLEPKGRDLLEGTLEDPAIDLI